jgi:hypothetical protein
LKVANSNDWHTPGPSIHVPFGAGPNDPFIDIGTNPPALLVAYYATLGVSCVAAEIFQTSANNYWFRAVVIGGGITGVGYGVVAGTTVADVHEVEQSIFTAGIAAILYGFNGNAIFQFGSTFGTAGIADVRIALGSTLTIKGHASFVSNPWGALAIETLAPFTIEGISAPRGVRAYVDSTVNSAAVGAEAVVLTLPAFDVLDGRVYSFEIRAPLTASVANTSNIRLRKTDAAGQLIDLRSRGFVAGALGDVIIEVGHFCRAAGAGDLAAVTFVVTLAASAGTTTMNATTTSLRYAKITDVGAVSDAPWTGNNLIAIV